MPSANTATPGYGPRASSPGRPSARLLRLAEALAREELREEARAEAQLRAIPPRLVGLARALELVEHDFSEAKMVGGVKFVFLLLCVL